MTYDTEIAFAKSMASQAAALLNRNFGLATSATWKADDSPLTDTDVTINQLVIRGAQSEFPDDGVLGEEDSFATDRKRLWVVDPIDGTHAFVLGAPLSTFCLSLVVDGQPVLGVICDPYLNRLYWAVQGHGAYLNDSRISVSSSSSLERSHLYLSGRLSNVETTTGQLFDRVESIGAKAFIFRSFAYGSMYVANGRAAGAILGVGHPWDAAATKIIVEEAGGKVTDIDGKDRRFDQLGKGLLATNGKVHEQLLALIHKSG